MVGNFRWVLIFVTFVVDLAVTKVFHPRKLMPTMIWLCESMMMAVATNIIDSTANTSHGVLISNSNHCHPADSVFDTNILLSHAVCPSLCRYMYGFVIKKIASTCIDYIIACAVPCPLNSCCHEI